MDSRILERHRGPCHQTIRTDIGRQRGSRQTGNPDNPRIFSPDEFLDSTVPRSAIHLMLGSAYLKMDTMHNELRHPCFELTQGRGIRGVDFLR